jgi:hypothetical protein
MPSSNNAFAFLCHCVYCATITPVPEFLERHKFCTTQKHVPQIFWKTHRAFVSPNTWSRVSGPLTDFLSDINNVSQISRNAQSHCVTQNCDSRLSGTAHNLRLIKNIWKPHRTSVRPKRPSQEFLDHSQIFCVTQIPNPEFLENAQNPRLTESPDPEISETCTESLCHLNHLIEIIIWKSRKTSVGPNPPSPDFLDHPQNFCVTEYRFQNFWNMGK